MAVIKMHRASGHDRNISELEMVALKRAVVV